MNVNCSIALILLAFMHVAMAAEIVQTKVFPDGSENCEGVPSSLRWDAVVNQCTMQFSTMSVKFTSCESYDWFLETGNCTGTNSTNIPVSTGCTVLGIALDQSCLSVPDNMVAKQQTGHSCTEDDEVTDAFSEEIMVLGVCRPFTNDEVAMSERFTVSNGRLQTTIFTTKTDCTGPFTFFFDEIGTCVEFSVDSPARRMRRRLQDEVDKIAIKIFPAFEGVSLGNPPTSSPPTPDSGDDDDDDDKPRNNNTGNANKGSAAGVVTFLVATIACALMF